MEAFDKEKQKEKKITEVKTFPVPFFLEESKKNITISTNTPSKTPKEQIIKKAFKFHSDGNISEAEKYYRLFIDEGFKDYRVFANYGIILKSQDKLKEAEISMRKAIELKPNFANSYFNLGNILINLCKLKEAEISLRKAIELNPNFALAYFNLGGVLKDLDKLKEAELSTRKAIELNPSHAMSHSNLGAILKDFGKLEEAEIFTRKAVDLNPDSAIAHWNLGNILLDLSKYEEARKSCLKSAEIEPKEIHRLSILLHILNMLCSWDEIENYSKYLNKIGLEGKAINPFHLLYFEDNPLNELNRAIRFHENNKSKALPNLSHYNNHKIKVGYFSSDFHRHSVSLLITRILELHDKSKFEVYAYSFSNIKDEYTERIKKAVFCFREITSLNDMEVVKLARKDQIDIAIDLNGFTKNNRMSMFLYRLAPIQINYLGYPGTIGSEYYDYKIADKVLIPENNKKFFVEKILYMPNSSFPPFEKINIEEHKFNKKDLGLPTDRFIFTCFSDIRKINKMELQVWMRLLKKVEKSVLWLLKPNKTAQANILFEINKNSIDPERIIFAETMNFNDHLSRLSCADLFLDTFNVSNATTAMLALSFGLPIITLLGKSYSSRQAASILNAFNLNELITHSYSEYEDLACKIATNKQSLNKIHKKLNDKKNLTFTDSYKFTQQLESIYTNILQN
ncbi:tetratricopeptide repeat protein [Prochlorococcus sp. MIT 0916]|uniref:O-linked N-acetylglucosamine transferase, SPINDLY family protein n=1 Tax=Prochlorococcus sp. MIT 0916 TaxID=3082521 RepID=UPI0039B55D8F